MAQEARTGHERAHHHHDDERRCPGGYVDRCDSKEGIRPVGAHRFDGEEEKDPDRGAHDGCVGVEEEDFCKDVEPGGEGGKGCERPVVSRGTRHWESDGGEWEHLRPMNNASAVSVPYSLSNRSSNGVNAMTFMTM